MRYSQALVLTLAAALGSAQDVMDLVTQIPACAQTCLIMAAQAVTCDLTDVNCLCTKQPQIQTAATPCLTQACSSDEITKLISVTSKICSPGGGGSSEAGGATTAAAPPASAATTGYETTPTTAAGSGNGTVPSNSTITRPAPTSTGPATAAAATEGAAVGIGFLAAAAVAVIYL